MGDVPANHTTIAASGTAAQVNRAFGITLGDYRTSGHVVRAADRAPSVPASLSDIVRGVIGLTPVRVHHGAIAPPPAYRSGRPCSAYWAAQMATDQPAAFGRLQPRAICGYTPVQMQGAYGMTNAINTGNDGSGVTVAVIDAFAAPTVQKDLNIYSSRHGLPLTTIHQITLPPCPHCPPGMQQGWWGEETLDLDAVHSMAPGANLLFWGAASPWDMALRHAMNDIVDNGRADIITNSYADPTEQQPASDVAAWHDTFIQAGVQGIGVYFSSGDEGDNIATEGYRTTELPASDPLVTAVGGTSLAVGATNSYLFETGWGTAASSRTKTGWTGPAWYYGGGGGTSRIFSEPGYQQSVVPDHLAGYFGGRGRVVPDVAADGDPSTGLLIGETQTFPDGSVRYGEYRIGGTSLSSPLFAGMMALADQAAGRPHGFANPLFYALGAGGAFHDVVTRSHTISVVRTDFNNGVGPKSGRYYTLRVMNHTGTLHTRVGYDDVTGMGTPHGGAFLNALVCFAVNTGGVHPSC